MERFRYNCQFCQKPIKKGVCCGVCRYISANCIRNCPSCGEEIQYKTHGNKQLAERSDAFCRTCINQKRDYSGENNPFYGKHHSQEAKLKHSAVMTGKNLGVKDPRKGRSGERNNMYGKSIYSVWLEKYGKEIADKKQLEFNEKQSIAQRGEKNKMYGKIPGIGAGNGISGWYKDWYFRSLHELTYMIHVIERFNLHWKSAESREFAVKYVNENGTQRNYFCDFIINDKYIIEIKPKALRKTKENLLKFEAAKKQFVDLKFKVVSVLKNITGEQLKNLINKGDVKLLDRWKNKI